MHGSRGSVEGKSSTVTADRDAFAKTKPCVEVFTGYQKWRKRGRKAGLGCNVAREMMKQKGFSSHCGFFRRNNAGKKRVELSYEQAHSELRADKLCGCGEEETGATTMTARQVSNKVRLQLRVRAAAAAR